MTLNPCDVQLLVRNNLKTMRKGGIVQIVKVQLFKTYYYSNGPHVAPRHSLHISGLVHHQLYNTLHSISLVIRLRLSSPVQGVEGLFAALHVALKRLLLGVNAHVDLEAVRGEEGLPTALLVAHERVLAPVGLLVGAQVPCRAVRPRAAFEHALVALHLLRGGQEG